MSISVLHAAETAAATSRPSAPSRDRDSAARDVALLAARRGDPPRALALAEECLAWAERSASNKNVVKARRLRGQACLAEGRVKEAENEIAAALELAEDVGSPPQIWSTHAALGDVRRAQGRPEEARDEYRAALRLIEEVAAQLTDEDLRATFLASGHVRFITKMAETRA